MRTVLIVEDDHDTRVALRDAFEEAGYSVFTAANGKDGLETLRTLRMPLVVVLDQNMPIMSGDSFLMAREQEPELRKIPVIVMSAVTDRSSKYGATDFMNKPLDIAVLILKCNRYLDGGPSSPPMIEDRASAEKSTAKVPGDSEGSSFKIALKFEPSFSMA